jgi:CHAT domain-containing protein
VYAGLLLLFAGPFPAIGVPSSQSQTRLDAAVASRERGEVNQSIEELQILVREAPDARVRTLALTQLGLSFTAADRLADAERALQSALAASAGSERPPVLLALGNVALMHRDEARAIELYRSVIAVAGSEVRDRGPVIAARLNLVRLMSDRDKLTELEQLFPEVEALPGASARARAYLNLAAQASPLFGEEVQIERVGLPTGPGESLRSAHGERGQRLLELAYRSLTAAQRIGLESHDVRVEIEAADGIAQIYELDGRLQEALSLDLLALASLSTRHSVRIEDLLMRLEWRAGRLERASGAHDAAVASYLRATDHLSAISRDLPLEDASGQSIYRTVLRPVYGEAADLLLEGVDRVAPEERTRRLSAITDLIEVTRQAELQDFLGDRCSVQSPRDRQGDMDRSTAVLYTAVLGDRIELILKHGATFEHHAVPMGEIELGHHVLGFRRDLYAGGETYRTEAQALYGLLVAPFEASLSEDGTRYLVIVPDGVLRLVPFAALRDGEHFLGERYAVASVVGLSLTGSARLAKRGQELLLGLSEPGPVVGKLIGLGVVPQTLDASVAKRGPPGTGAGRDSAEPAVSLTDRSLAERALRSDLALPGVRKEILGLASISSGSSFLDSSFTVARLRSELASGRYDRVHIASHAFFGDSARDSFLLTYDDVVRIDDLQALISTDAAQGIGLDLLTLSACDTAEGDDRAPLGFAGAAIKAQARTVIGSLWAVNDAATQQFMRSFYSSLATHTKGDALMDAQKAMISSRDFSHPYYWAAFSLIGEWR